MNGEFSISLSKIDKNTIAKMVSNIINESKLFEDQLLISAKSQLPRKKRMEFHFKTKKLRGEGEWEEDIFAGFTKVYEYLNTSGVQSTFLIIYPNKLKRKKTISPNELKNIEVKVWFLRKNGRNYIKSHQIKDLAEILKNNSAKPLEEIDLRIIIDTLHLAVSLVTPTIETEKMDNIFLNTLFAEEKVEESIINTSASYFLLNQLVFYRILASSDKYKGKLKIIEPNDIIQSGDLDEIFFIQVNRITRDFYAIYDICISKFVKDIEVLKQIISFVNTIAPERITGDYLGKVFHQLIPKKLRKEVASYYTLEESAYLLSKLAIFKEEQIVCDPSCGSGTLLGAAYQRKKELLENSREFTLTDHSEFLKNQLFGADIMPFAAHLATIHLALQDSSNLNNTAHIEVMDSNNLMVDRNLFPPCDVFLMNPPFTKKQRLAIQSKNPSNLRYRDKIKDMYQEYYSENILTNKSPYYAFFLCLADSLLGKNSNKSKSIGAVLPAIILRNKNENMLREHILSNYWIKYIIVREDKCNFSEDTSLREILLILNKNQDLNREEERVVKYVFIHDFNYYKSIAEFLELNTYQLSDITNGLITKGNGTYSTVCIPQNELSSQNIFYPISIFSFNYDYLHFWLDIRESYLFQNIKDIDGIEIITKNAPEPSKSNLSFRDTAILKEEYRKDSKDMILNAEKTTATNIFFEFTDTSSARRQVNVPKTHVKLGLRYISQKSQIDVSDLEEFVLWKNVKEMNFENANWEIWDKYLKKRSAHIAFVDRMDYTSLGYRLLAFYSEKERVIARTTGALKGISKNYAKLITLWFNSSFGILEWLIFRSPQRFGYCQHHKFTIERLVVPEESVVEPSKVDEIMNLLKDSEFPSLLEQFVRLIPTINVYELREILEKYKLQNISATDFEPRVILDNFFYRILIDKLKKKELLRLIEILVIENTLSDDIGIIQLRKLMIEQDFMEIAIKNLHYRIAKIILLSKRAMDEKR